MPTTETTKTVNLGGRLSRTLTRYKPTIIRMISATSVTTGSTELVSDFIPTHDFRLMRVTLDPRDVSVGTTATFTVETAPTTVAAVNTVQTSSGGVSITFGSTHSSAIVRHIFLGLDRFTRVRAVLAGDTAATTGLFIDGEFT